MLTTRDGQPIGLDGQQTDETSAIGKDTEQNDGENTENSRMMRAELVASVLGPALEQTEDEYVRGLQLPRGPPPPVHMEEGTAAASSSDRSMIAQPSIEARSAPEMTTCMLGTEQQTLERISRDRSRTPPRVPVRRHRPSTFGRSAGILEQSLISQRPQLTMEQRQSAVEVASCIRALLARAGFDQSSISAGADEARSRLLHSWVREDRAQQEDGEVECNPAGSDEEVE